MAKGDLVLINFPFTDLSPPGFVSHEQTNHKKTQNHF